jgi:hypothetical protein
VPEEVLVEEVLVEEVLVEEVLVEEVLAEEVPQPVSYRELAVQQQIALAKRGPKARHEAQGIPPVLAHRTERVEDLPN